MNKEWKKGLKKDQEESRRQAIATPQGRLRSSQTEHLQALEILSNTPIHVTSALEDIT
jgi:hypothetical protein